MQVGKLAPALIELRLVSFVSVLLQLFINTSHIFSFLILVTYVTTTIELLIYICVCVCKFHLHTLSLSHLAAILGACFISYLYLFCLQLEI